MTALPVPTIQFTVPDDLTATEPAEHRGLARDGVRLLIGRPDRVAHSTFSQLGEHLDAGDLLVINNSQTLAAEVDGLQAGDWPTVIHVATELDDHSWVIELRTAPDGARPLLHAQSGEVIRLADAVRMRLLEPYPAPNASPTGHGTRLWRAQVISSQPFTEYLATHGRPISYGYLRDRWPLADYQTIFSIYPGSAEMPSAARPFSYELLARLIADGIGVIPITLHTGLSSQEAGEPPQPERFTVSDATARAVNSARDAGNRIIAVGTTVTRALESALGFDGRLRARKGWTDLVLGPHRPAQVVDGLITGLHNPDASHLLLVESVVGAATAQRAYDAAVAERYLWHEFGDSCLLLPL